MNAFVNCKCPNCHKQHLQIRTRTGEIYSGSARVTSCPRCETPLRWDGVKLVAEKVTA